MIVSQTEIDQINSRVYRLRVLRLPVRRGRRFGELKRCPMRVGVCRLKARIPYEDYRGQAQAQPTRARAVLWLIDRCEVPRKAVTITVREPPERQGDAWIVRFEKGDRPDLIDRDIYLCRHNDFTMVPSQQTVRGDAPYLAPFAEDLKRARAKALEKREEPNRSGIAAMRAANRRMAVRKHDMKITARRRLTLIERETEKLAAELSVDSDATLSPSDCVQSESGAEADGDCPPTDLAAVSLESAA